MLLQGSVRLVVVSFLSFNLNFLMQVPACIRKKERANGSAPSKKIRGTRLIPPTAGVYGIPLFKDLEGDYVLVEASQKTRETKERRPFAEVQFVFAAQKYARVPEKFDRDAVSAVIYQMLGRYTWTVTAYDNPFLESGELVEGQRCVIINLDKRQPLFDDNGGPITKWRGEHRVPVEPELFLGIDNGELCVQST